MSHSHSHQHHHHVPSEGDRDGEWRLLVSIGLNLLITVAEFIGGIVSGSLALLSDALHNFSDTASLGVSYGARRIGRRAPTREKTFGYQRAEVIGAFVNLVVLVLVALFLIKEAVERFLDPHPIDGGIMLAVASVGLVANLVTALLLHRPSKGSLNIKSAFLHIVADTVSSVGVVLGGVLVITYEAYFVDPVLTLGISLYILYHSYEMLRDTANILMQGTPRDVDLSEIVAAVQDAEAVLDVHHVHVWKIDERQTALEAHVVIDERDLHAMESIKHAIKERLRTRFGIGHSTLEFELRPCDRVRDPRCYDAGKSTSTAS